MSSETTPSQLGTTGVEVYPTGGSSPTADSQQFAPALRAAIHARGLSLDRIRHRLAERGAKVSVATLSYWQSGRSRPERSSSLAALGHLEEILDVPRGFLASRLATRPVGTASSGGYSQAASMEGIAPGGDLMTEIVNQLGLSWDDGLERISYHDRMMVKADQTDGAQHVRTVMVARREGVDRFPVWYHHDDPKAYPFIVAVTNCRLGRVIEVRGGAVAAELLLERPLRLGEPILVEHQLEAVGQTTPQLNVIRGCAGPIREIVQEVTFNPSMLPSSAHRMTIIDGVEHTEEIDVTQTLQMLSIDCGPGVYGLKWTW